MKEIWLTVERERRNFMGEEIGIGFHRFPGLSWTNFYNKKIILDKLTQYKIIFKPRRGSSMRRRQLVGAIQLEVSSFGFHWAFGVGLGLFKLGILVWICLPVIQLIIFVQLLMFGIRRAYFKIRPGSFFGLKNAASASIEPRFTGSGQSQLLVGYNPGHGVSKDLTKLHLLWRGGMSLGSGSGSKTRADILATSKYASGIRFGNLIFRIDRSKI